MSGLVNAVLNSRTCFHWISACLCSIHSGRPNRRAASSPPAQPPGVTQAGLDRCFCSQCLDSQHIYNHTLITEFHALFLYFHPVLILFSSARFCLSSLIFHNHPVHFSPPRSHNFLLPASLEWAFYCLFRVKRQVRRRSLSVQPACSALLGGSHPVFHLPPLFIYHLSGALAHFTAYKKTCGSGPRTCIHSISQELDFLLCGADMGRLR